MHIFIYVSGFVSRYDSVEMYGTCMHIDMKSCGIALLYCDPMLGSSIKSTIMYESITSIDLRTLF